MTESSARNRIIGKNAETGGESCGGGRQVERHGQ
jgi:hypothetical protein